MTDLEYVEDTIYKENITYDKYHLANKKACIIHENNKYYILLDRNKAETDAETKSALIEELGHYYTNSLYNDYTWNDPVIVNKAEYRAKKWAYIRYIPINILKEYPGMSVYDLANMFNVSESFMIDAIQFYKDRGEL